MRIRYLALASGRNTPQGNSSRKHYPVVKPYTTVCQEEFGLDRTRGFVRERRVVRAVYDAVVDRAGIGVGECGVDVSCVCFRGQYDIQAW